MSLFTLLLVLTWERLFKLGEHWQLDRHLRIMFRQVHTASLPRTLIMLLLWIALVSAVWWVLHGLFFGVVALLFSVSMGLLCLGAGVKRQYYHRYLLAVRQGDRETSNQMMEKLALIHGLPAEGEEARLRELQNSLLWINFRYYLAPIFWLVVAGSYGPAALAGYAFLRAYQSWLAQQPPLIRAQSGVDALLHVLDWLPVRLAGLGYALVGHGERALPAWFASLGDRHSSPYQVLTRLAQYALSRDPHLDALQTPTAAVSLAQKVALMVLVVVSLLTIYGTLM